jgi:hypothetical protein
VNAFRTFVRESLEQHYDPTYLASMKRNFARFGNAEVKQ